MSILRNLRWVLLVMAGGVLLMGASSCGGDPEVEAHFTYSVGGGEPPLTVTFDGSSSISRVWGEEPVCAWNLGDGTTAAGTVVTHTYSMTGEYQVQLTASAGSSQDTAQATIYCVDPPVVSFTASSAPASLEIRFDATQTVPGPSVALLASQGDSYRAREYRWDFGDGTVQTLNPGGAMGFFSTIFPGVFRNEALKPIHTYAFAGTYTVTLTVTDTFGLSGSSSQTLVIGAEDDEDDEDDEDSW